MRTRLSRRDLLKIGAGGLLASLAVKPEDVFGGGSRSLRRSSDDPIEFIVVGSGAGGGPLACNLAKAGHKVVLIEAGGDEADDIAAFPAFHTLTSEDPRISWAFFVRHYANDERQLKDTKFVAERDGVYYPRVGGLGGCTVHSALVEMYPSNSNWDDIAALTGDSSWRATNMRRYYERFEQCRYAVPQRGNPSRHGFHGWQPAEFTNPQVFAEDEKLQRVLQSEVQALGLDPGTINRYFSAQLDPNDWRVLENREGLYNTPLFMQNGRRVGPRQLIRQTAAAFPNNLIVKLHTLVTRVLFEGTTAVGVEFLESPHLYRADPNASQQGEEPVPRQTMRVTREVILAGGAFNSPQLLKLSGIGPAAELSALGIPTIVDRPGVGENLQDRYEAVVITEMNSDFTFGSTCRPGQADDPCLSQWLQGGGPYTSTGVLNFVLKKTNTAISNNRPDPDICILGGPARFSGYFPGYSLEVATIRNQYTWAVLAAHTVNRGGTVKLRSADPRDTPLINFHYFEEGTDTNLEDLNSVVDGIEILRQMNSHLTDIANGELIPGPEVDTREELAEFVQNEAWGHHASCSNKMGPATDPMAVVDTNFRVHGTQNLRIVDASVFPRIPGYFILTPIYMISEKASDVILADHGSATDVTHQVSVTRGGFRRDRATGRYLQEVTLTNTGGSPISGPVSLVLDGLSGNASLFGAASVTSTLAPLGSPFLDVDPGGNDILSPGESITVVLEFVNPADTAIDYLYGVRVLAGTGMR